MMWGEHLSRRHWEYQKGSNDNNYCYMNTNRHCVKENNSYVHNLPTYNNRLAVNILEADNKNHDYVKNDYKAETTMLDHITVMNPSVDVSKTVSPSPCNNLYVSPPYFTVDKFVNMEQTNHRDTRQIIQPNRNYNNQKEMSNISLEYKIPENRESFLINNKNLIGIKVIENSHIPLVHFDTSDRPVRLNVPKQYEQEPVIAEICNYENDLVSYGSEPYQKRKKPYPNIEYVQDPNIKNDYIHNQLLSIHQYSGESIIKVESKNLYRVADLNATIESSQHRVVPNDFHCVEFQRNSLQNGYEKSCITPVKNISREKRKPNYRQLINNAHALRNSISENDLNMQIIKRTLNYKQLPTYNYPPRNIAIQSLKRNNDNLCPKPEKGDIYEKTHVNHLFIQHQDESSLCKKPNIASPLDLSLKNVKTEVDVDKKNAYEALIIEKGCPPKYNFEPNFLEKHNFMSNNVNSNTSRMQSNHSSVIRYSSNSIRPATDCKLDQNLFLPAPKAEVKATIVNQVVDKIGAIEVEVTRKRTFPVENFDETKYFMKKKCYNSSFCTSLSSDSGNFEEDFEKKIDLIRNVQIKTTNDCDVAARYDHTIIKPEPEPELELELKPELEPALKRELELELKFEPETEPEAEADNLIELKQEVSSAFASRIRTKAERKGFVFQDEGVDVQSKNLELNNQLDLCAWNSTCDRFVDQLDHCLENNSPKNEFSKSLQRSMPNVQIDSENESLDTTDSSNLSPKRSIKRMKTDKQILPTINFPVELDVYCEDRKLNESTELTNSVADSVNNEVTNSVADSVNTELMDNNTESVNAELIDNVKEFVNAELTNDVSGSDDARLGDNVADSTTTDLIDSVTDSSNSLPASSEAEERCKFVEEDVSKDKNEQSTVDHQNLSSPDSSPDKNPNTPNSKTTRVFDLTKVSVVRLKREKYVSRILKQSDETMVQTSNAEKDHSPEIQTNDDAANCKSSNSKLPTSPSEKQYVLRNTEHSYAFGRGRKQNINKVSKKIQPNLNNIKTRLRTKGLQGKNDSVFKKKNKNKKTNRRFENKSEGEQPDNTEKIFLEVYRYKRALKIPPNLITIKNKCVQKISKSIPDSDFDPKTTHKNGESTQSFEMNKDNVPKSIIDVLHSRVIKAKHQHNKFTQKYVKNERHQVPKSKVQQFGFSKSKTDQQILNENNNVCLQEKRNVFETQVIPSRTRREHKMQLNQETIREVFRGDERPSSAPPQITTLEDIYDKSYNDQCIKYFQKLSLCAESDLQKLNHCQNGEHENANKNVNGENGNTSTCSNKIKEPEKVKEDNQCNNSIKPKRRKRRIYKRRISSGFDYLRKKKRANTCALRNYPRFKRRKSMTEENFSFRNESDILKEIQKWVLNKGVGQSALHKAATLGYIDVIVYCLEKMGLHPDHKDNAGYTPLHDACVNGSLDIARVLLQYGANHSESAHSGIRPIHEASENGHIEIVRMLLSYGADPLLETYSGQTPLMLASDPKMNNLISMHLSDVQMGVTDRKTWKFQGPWNTNDNNENGCDILSDVSSIENLDASLQKRHNFRRDFRYFQNNEWKTDGNEIISICNQNPSIKNIFCDFEFLYDAANAEGELFEFEEAASPLPPLYLLKDEGMEKWVLLSDLCSLLKVKSKDTLLHKIFPSVSPSHVSRAFLRELKMCEFLERATCLQLLCAGEKINICHSKVVLIRYNENVRNLLGVKTIIMKL